MYLLGGTAALSDTVADDVAALGIEPVRLHGPTRVETAIAIAREVERRLGPAETVVVARSNAPANNPTAAWADSIAAGGLAAIGNRPLLLTPTATLHPAVAAYLAEHPRTGSYAIGGELALSTTVVQALPNPQRLAGDSRDGTAAAIAAAVTDTPQGYILVDGSRTDGWAWGLPAALLTASFHTPVLLADSTDTLPPATDAAIADTCWTPVLALGDATVITDAALDGLACDNPDGGPCNGPCSPIPPRPHPQDLPPAPDVPAPTRTVDDLCDVVDEAFIHHMFGDDLVFGYKVNGNSTEGCFVVLDRFENGDGANLPGVGINVQ